MVTLTTLCGWTKANPARMTALTATLSEVKNTELSASTVASSRTTSELPLESWRVPYAAAGWSTALFSYLIGDMNAAEV